MESVTKFGNEYDSSAAVPLGLPNRSHADLYPNNFSCAQNSFDFLQHFPLITLSKPFDPFLHGSSSGLGLHGYNPYEGNPVPGAAMQGFNGREILKFSNAKDILMDIRMTLDEFDPNHVEFVIPPDESSCVTHNENNALDGKNGIKRSKSISKNNMRARALLTRTTSRRPKKSKSMKGQWTVEEDKLLIRLVEIYGVRKWSHIAQMIKGRIGKQCRERWHNHLRPDIKKDQWSEEEDRVLIEAHSEVGNKWAEIAKRLSGRTENSIKNHWNATKRRQLSRRKCRTKWPKPSYVLQNYIKSLYSEEGGDNKKSKNIIDTPPSMVIANNRLGNLNVNNTLTKVAELDSSHVDCTGTTEYDDLDIVLADFAFDDFQAFNARSSMDSSLGDVSHGTLPPEVDDGSCFDFDQLPFDVASIIPM